MIKNPELLEQAMLEYEREHPLTLKERFELFEQMHQLAVELGRFRENRYEEDIEEIVSLAKALHGKLPTTSGTHSPSAGKAKMLYMVIGGQAVLIHGRPRFTGDIYITLGVDVDRLSEVREITEKLGLRPRRHDVEELAKRTNVFLVVEKESNINIDFIFSYSEYGRDAIRRARPIRVRRTSVQYASPEDVIIHKLVAGRPIDITDAKSILNAQRGINKEYVNKWLKEYSGIVGRDLQREFQSIDRGVSKKS